MTREEAIKEIKMWGIEAPRQRAVLETLIPELRESEDERIRRWLLEQMREWRIHEDCPETESKVAKAITWIEKQKEPTPVDKFNESMRIADKWEEGYEAGVYDTEQRLKTGDKPVEWSEEDERKRLACIDTINEVIDYERDRWEDYNPGKPYRPITKYDEQVDWLKSLRPSWKPIEDEGRLINASISFLKDFADKGYENAVECIDWLKSKLNGNACK